MPPLLLLLWWVGMVVDHYSGYRVEGGKGFITSVYLCLKRVPEGGTGRPNVDARLIELHVGSSVVGVNGSPPLSRIILQSRMTPPLPPGAKPHKRDRRARSAASFSLSSLVSLRPRW